MNYYDSSFRKKVLNSQIQKNKTKIEALEGKNKTLASKRKGKLALGCVSSAVVAAGIVALAVVPLAVSVISALATVLTCLAIIPATSFISSANLKYDLKEANHYIDRLSKENEFLTQQIEFLEANELESLCNEKPRRKINKVALKESRQVFDDMSLSK